MKRIVSLLLTVSAWAQQSSVATRTYDVNGRPVEGVRTIQSNGSQVKVTEGVNGRVVPVESVEERVISDPGGVRIVERTVRRHDQNGRPGPAERVRIEERKEADGSTRVSTTVSRGDVNGKFQIAERALTSTRVSGGRTESSTLVERPTPNGTMEAVERRDLASTTSGAKTAEEAVTYQRDPNGRMTPVTKTVREAVNSGGVVNENIAEYESVSTGQMRIRQQSTARVEPTGTREVTVYQPDAQGELRLFQHRIIEKAKTPTGATETVSVRMPLPSDPAKLGPARKVEERVCTGECR